MESLIIVIAVIASIALGFAFKVNIAIFGMSFAYIIGAFVLDLSTGTIIGLFPTSLFFFLFSVTYFYGFALKNGTLTKFAEKGIYMCRNIPFMIPIAMYIVAFIMSGVGAGPFAVFAFLAPLYMVVADEIKMSKVLTAMIIVGAGVAGGYTPISLCYATVRNVLITVGYEAALGAILPRVALNNMIAHFILFAVGYFVFKGFKVTARDAERPEPFTGKQRTTLVLIAIGLLAYVVFPFLKAMAPDVAVFAWINSKLDTGLIAMVLIAVSLVLKVGDEKEAMSAVPWNTIILICGMGMLIAVAVQAGAIDQLSEAVAGAVTPITAPILMGICSGVMSLFSSTLGVVAPTLGILIPSIADASGVSVTVLASIMMIGGHFAGHSPFSTGGAMALTGVQDEAERNSLMLKLIGTAVGALILALIMVFVGIIR